MRAFLTILGLVILFASSNAEFTRLEWTDCGSPQVQFFDIAIKPMPILQPGQASFTFKVNLLRGLNAKLRTDMNIIRTVSGLSIPIRCYLAAGVYVGSCIYDDLCSIISQLVPDSFNPTNCPPELAQFGIDCTCPFKIATGNVNIVDTLAELPDASTSIATFLASGDFDITIKTEDVLGKYACLRVKFTVKPSKPGK